MDKTYEDSGETKLRKKIKKLPADLYDLLSEVFSGWGIEEVITNVDGYDDITVELWGETQLTFRYSNKGKWLVKLHGDLYAEAIEVIIWMEMYFNKKR